MSFEDLAPELLHQVYNHLSTITDVINLSMTCHRFNALLRNSHKLSTLFAAADREFGPIQDIKMVVTHSHATPAHVKRDPPLSYSLLRQVVAVGTVGKRFEQLYPSKRWDTNFMSRRSLTDDEAWRVRRAMYRYWLYSLAFHNRMHPRTYRLMKGVMEERSQLLRNWSNMELFEIEDVRSILEDILTFQICPTDGNVRARGGGKPEIFLPWHHSLPPVQSRQRLDQVRNIFHGRGEHEDDAVLPVRQARAMKMEGWGDEISQYHTVQSMLKLNPGQILWLYDHAVHKWQVESLVYEMGEEWFWENGQTFSDTWSLVLHARGEDVDHMRNDILEGRLGVACD